MYLFRVNSEDFCKTCISAIKMSNFADEGGYVLCCSVLHCDFVLSRITVFVWQSGKKNIHKMLQPIGEQAGECA